ncbi:hypothetical protein PINS_up005787 [Pythium insidiosum]|nr:hypothetical protein PINS_up005787 [Pythium insidiosum]
MVSLKLFALCVLAVVATSSPVAFANDRALRAMNALEEGLTFDSEPLESRSGEMYAPGAVVAAGEEDCDDGLPIAGDDDCDDGLPVAGDEDCDDGLPVAGDDDCDDGLPVAGDDDCDDGLPVAGDDDCDRDLPEADDDNDTPAMIPTPTPAPQPGKDLTFDALRSLDDNDDNSNSA